MYNSVMCFIDFLRMALEYPNEYMRPSTTREEWEQFVFDMEPLIARKWGL